MRNRFGVLAAALLAGVAWPAAADIAVSSNDGRQTLVEGVASVVKAPTPDTVTVIDLAGPQPKVLATIEAPGSAVGPPFSVVVTADESLAIVSSPMKLDPADPTKQVADNRLSVIDLTQKPPKVTQTIEAGKSPSGMSLNRAGNLLLVANRGDGTVSSFKLENRQLSPVAVVKAGDEKSGPSHVQFTPDGKTALVTRDGDHAIAVLAVDGSNVTLTPRAIRAGLRPYAMDIAPQGDFAFVGDLGFSSGDVNTVSILDLKATPIRVVDKLVVGATPEGVKLSPDGMWVAVAINNGSNLAASSPLYSDHGVLKLYRRNGAKLTPVAEAPVQRWSQGIAFSADGKTILVQSMQDRAINVFKFDGKKLTAQPSIKLEQGAAAIRTAERPLK